MNCHIHCPRYARLALYGFARVLILPPFLMFAVENKKKLFLHK